MLESCCKFETPKVTLNFSEFSCSQLHPQVWQLQFLCVWFDTVLYYRLFPSYPRPGLDHTLCPEVLLDQNFRKGREEDELPHPCCPFRADGQMILPGSCLELPDLTLDQSSRDLASLLD